MKTSFEMLEKQAKELTDRVVGMLAIAKSDDQDIRDIARNFAEVIILGVLVEVFFDGKREGVEHVQLQLLPKDVH